MFFEPRNSQTEELRKKIFQSVDKIIVSLEIMFNLVTNYIGYT